MRAMKVGFALAISATVCCAFSSVVADGFMLLKAGSGPPIRARDFLHNGQTAIDR